jgi:hypothetical protein
MSKRKPNWLPEILSLDGDWQEKLLELYAVFDRDFKQADPRFDGIPIWWDRRILDEKYEEGFWHLISKNDRQTRERLVDYRRAERLPWCGPMINNASDNAVKVWADRSGKKRIRTYVWLEQWDYVIILEKRRHRTSDVFFLITAFYVDGDSTRRHLGKKYTNRVR